MNAKARRAPSRGIFREAARLQHEIEDAFGRMATTQQALARAWHVDPSRVTQLKTTWKGAVAFIQKCAEAGRASYTDGLALAMVPLTETIRASLEHLSDAQLGRLRERIFDEWIALDGEEAAASYEFVQGGDAERFARAHTAEATASLHLAAIALEMLRRRGVSDVG